MTKKTGSEVRKLKVTFFLDRELDESLNSLSKYTRVNKSVYIREGIQMVLEKYKRELILFDAGRVKFRDMGPLFIQLVEEGKYKEAEELEEVIMDEIGDLQRLMSCVRNAAEKNRPKIGDVESDSKDQSKPLYLVKDACFEGTKTETEK